MHYVLKLVLHLFAALASLLQLLTLLALQLLQLAFAPAASPQALSLLLHLSAIHLRANQRSESM
jgi:hypothetical protein